MLYDWLKNIDFTYKPAFALFALLPVMIWWYIAKSNRQQSAVTVSSAQAFTVSSRKIFFRHLPFILRLLALSCLILTLAHPQKHIDEKNTKGEGIDIVISMDVSGSMLTDDFLPSRLEVSKEMAADFVRSRPVDRIGLVIFSGESYTQCPVTTDKNTLLTQIDALRSGMLLDGTLIGEGLATAVDRLSKSSAKSKVIILLTDGKEEAPKTRLIDPLTALEIAKQQNVKVYTIGMSALNFKPVSEGVNQKRRLQNDAFLDEILLQRIAAQTGGKYFRAADKNGLKKIYNQIDQLEKSKIEIQAQRRNEELFLPFVLAALAFLFLEVWLRFTVFKKFP
jgi:Ca-activated chloride channel homolog